MNRTLKIILIIAASMVTGIGLIGFLAFNSMKEIPLTDVDKEMLLKPAEVLSYFEDQEVDEAAIKFTKLRYLDGSTEVEVDYDSIDEDQPSFTCTLSHSRSVSDAKQEYLLAWNAIKLGLKIGDSEIKVEEEKDFFKIGEQTRFGKITYKGKNLGNLITFRKNKNVMTFYCTGIYFDDAEILHEMLDGIASRMGDYK